MPPPPILKNMIDDSIERVLALTTLVSPSIGDVRAEVEHLRDLVALQGRRQECLVKYFRRKVAEVRGKGRSGDRG